MKFDEFYSKIPNPIDNDETLMEIIQTYSDTTFGIEQEFYNYLTRRVARDEKDEINKSDRNTFHVLLFNKIKNSIKNLTKEKYIELTKNGHGNSLLKLRKELLNVEDAKTVDEVNQIMNKIANKGLESTLRYYFAGSLVGGSWQHVSLHNTSGKLENYDNVEHRLYLNVARQDIYKLATILVEKMYEHNYPFYFKFDPYASRDDSLVIYSSSEHFLDNLEVLREIEQEYPEIVSRCKRPTILSGQVKNWIGYGSEPINGSEKRQSFNSVRTPIILNSIKEEWKNFIANNRKAKVMVNNKEMTFEELMADFCADKLLEEMKKNFNSFKGTEEEFQEKYGYGRKELESPRVPQIIKGIFKTQLPKIIEGYVKNDLKPEIKLNTRSKTYSIKYYVSDFSKDIKQILPYIVKNSPNLLESIRKRIKTELQKNGVNPNKICFDTYAEKSLKEFLEKLEKSKTPPLIKPSSRKKIETKAVVEQPKLEPKVETKAVIEQPKVEPKVKKNEQGNPAIFAKKEKTSIVDSIKKAKEKKETPIFANPKMEKESMVDKLKQEMSKKQNIQPKIKREYSHEDLEKADLNMLISRLNPAHLKKTMKLPNGTTMGLVEYLELIVFPHLPENGIIILENGMPMPIIHFIEHGVLGECQEKYNGNFPKYLYEKTKTNCGVLKLKNNGKDFDIDAEEITEYINQALLIRPLELPNNVKIPTPIYLKEYYANHIPYNGIVALPDGTKMTAPMYVEKILLNLLESKYNGNLPLALFETTRQNNGTIDLNLDNFDRNYESMLAMSNRMPDKPGR